jgi:hypothetical protein
LIQTNTPYPADPEKIPLRIMELYPYFDFGIITSACQAAKLLTEWIFCGLKKPVLSKHLVYRAVRLWYIHCG